MPQIHDIHHKFGCNVSSLNAALSTSLMKALSAPRILPLSAIANHSKSRRKRAPSAERLRCRQRSPRTGRSEIVPRAFSPLSAGAGTAGPSSSVFPAGGIGNEAFLK